MLSSSESPSDADHTGALPFHKNHVLRIVSGPPTSNLARSLNRNQNQQTNILSRIISPRKTTHREKNSIQKSPGNQTASPDASIKGTNICTSHLAGRKDTSAERMEMPSRVGRRMEFVVLALQFLNRCDIHTWRSHSYHAETALSIPDLQERDPSTQLSISLSCQPSPGAQPNSYLQFDLDLI